MTLEVASHPKSSETKGEDCSTEDISPNSRVGQRVPNKRFIIRHIWKYTPIVVVLGAVLSAFILAVTSSQEARLSSTGMCWDKVIRVRSVSENECRAIYLNLSMKTPFLLLTVYALLHAYISQILAALSVIGLVLGLISADPIACGSLATREQRKLVINLLGWEILARIIWAAATGYPIAYSTHILFIYINDGFYQLFDVQVIFCVSQICIYLHMSALFARRFETITGIIRYPQVAGELLCDLAHWSVSPGLVSPTTTITMGSVVLGMMVFKLGFNIFIECTCSKGTHIMRTAAFLFSDLTTLGSILWLDGAYEIFARAFAVTKRSSQEVKVLSLPALFRSYFGRESLFGLRSTTATKRSLLNQSLIVLFTALLSGLAVWLATAINDERIC